MNTVKTWAISLCGACMCVGVISFLKPHLKFDKVLKLALSAFLCIALISPFIGAKNLHISFDGIQEKEQQQLQKKGEDFLMRAQVNAAADNVKKEIENRLRQKDFTFREVTVSMNIDTQENISINEIAVSGVPRQQRQALYDMLKKELSLEVTVQ